MSDIVEAGQTPVAVIRRQGAYLLVEPPGPWVEPFLVVRLRGAVGGPFGHSVEPEVLKLYRTGCLGPDRPAVQFWPGLLAVARGSMKERGYQVETAVAAPPVLRRDDAAPVTDPGVVEFVGRNERGVIRADVGRGASPAGLVAQVAAAFPGAKVVVIVPTRKAAGAWRQELQRVVRDVAVCTFKSPCEGSKRVVVATPGALGMLNLGAADVVIVADLLRGVGDDPLAVTDPDAPPARGGAVHGQPA